MAITDLIENIKFDISNKNIDFTSKNISYDKKNSFSNIFESTNKNYDLSLDKKKDYEVKKEFKSKEFKSDYENFHNNVSKDKLKELKESHKAKKSEHHEQHEHIQKNEITEKSEKPEEPKKEVSEEISKEKTSSEEQNTKQNTTEEKPEEASKETEVNNTNINEETAKTDEEIASLNIAVVIEQSIQATETDSDENPQQQEVQTQNNEQIKVSAANLQGEVKALTKQAENEKPAEKLPEKTLENPDKLAKKEEIQVKKEEKQELKAEIKQEAKVDNNKQEEVKKPEFLASENAMHKLNALDKNPLSKMPEEKLNNLSQKLAETLNKEKDTPVITNIEIKNDAPKTDLGNQNSQTQQELKSSINPAQTISLENPEQKSEGVQQTARFDRILNTKQTDILQNSVLNQIKDKLSADATGKSQINIALKPENLGRVNINISSENGILTAKITAENNQVKDVLNKGLEQLKQNMTEQGIQVGKIVVNTQESNLSNQNQSQNQEHIFKNFEQSNSNTSNMENPNGKHARSEEKSSVYSSGQSFEFEEEIENAVETGILAEGSSEIIGTVDYKV